jgi:hypothetical protein
MNAGYLILARRLMSPTTTGTSTIPGLLIVITVADGTEYAVQCEG